MVPVLTDNMKSRFNITIVIWFVAVGLLMFPWPSRAWKPARSNNGNSQTKVKETQVIVGADIIPSYVETKDIYRKFTSKALPGLVEELLQYNPELKSLVDKINASRDRILQAASLDDPRFMFEVMNVPTGSGSLSRTPMSGIQLYLRQKVPFPTKLVTRKKIAKSRYYQMVQEYMERMNQLVGKFKRVYYDYAFTSDAVAIRGQNLRRLTALAAILEARYATGAIPQQDVLKIKLEADEIRSAIIKLNARRKILLARLNTLLMRPAGTSLKILRARSHRRFHKNLSQMVDLAKQSRPWLKKASYQVDEAGHAHTLAKEGLLPDFDFGVGYRIRNRVAGDPVIGQDFFSAGVAINIPFLWTLPKHTKQISETKSLVRSQEHIRQNMVQEVIYQVTHIYQDLMQYGSLVRLYRNRILPESVATVDSSLTSYEAGEVDYLNLITSQLALFRNELALVRYRYEYAKRRADLEVAVGRPL